MEPLPVPAFTSSSSAQQPPRGVKLLAKRLRRRREPSISGLQRHSTFAGDLGDSRPGTSLGDDDGDPDHSDDEAYDSDPEM
jgi:hypothetical protein